MQNALNPNDVTIVTVEGNCFRIYFSYMSKDEPSAELLVLLKAVDYYKTEKIIITYKNEWMNYNTWWYWNWKT